MDGRESKVFPGFPDPTSVNLPEDGSTTEPRYYAYGYYGPRHWI